MAPDRPRIRWDDGEPPPPSPRPPPARRLRGIATVAVLAGVAVLVTVLVTVLLTMAPGTGPVHPDRYAVPEVAQRYRALGSTLLTDALSCGPTAPQPGETEAVSCSFGVWTLRLAGYQERAALDAARARASTRGLDAVRWALRREPTGIAVLAETAAGASTVYWDSPLPRPVSATATATALPLPDLLAFVDARGAAQARPDLPGPAFRSGALWALAEPYATAPGASCRPLPAAEHLATSAEEVRCSLADGVEALFVRDRNAAEFERNRASFRSGVTAVPGTLRSEAWRPPVGDQQDGLLLSYVFVDDSASQLYADQPATSSWALLRGTDRTPDQLRAFWTRQPG